MHLRISCTCMMEMHACLTGPSETRNANFIGAKCAVIAHVKCRFPHFCKAESSFCPSVWKSASEEIYVLQA